MLAMVFLRIREMSFSSQLWQDTKLSQELHLLIRSGLILKAVALLQVAHPQLLLPGSALYLSLHVQIFIEFLREGDSIAALRSAQQALGPHKDFGVHTDRGSLTVREVMGLLCTQQAGDAAVGYLMSQEQREVVCTVLRQSLTEGS